MQSNGGKERGVLQSSLAEEEVQDYYPNNYQDYEKEKDAAGLGQENNEVRGNGSDPDKAQKGSGNRHEEKVQWPSRVR